MKLLTEGVSVVLAAKNAARQLPGFFKSLSRNEILELVLCDMGSTDGTVAIGRNAGAHVFRGDNPVETIRNAIEHCRGTALWFLPPNARPPEMAALYIIGAIEESGYSGGVFQINMTVKNKPKKMANYLANASAMTLGKVTINNGFFISRGKYEKLGGYPDSENPIRDLYKSLKKGYKIFQMADAIEIIED